MNRHATLVEIVKELNMLAPLSSDFERCGRSQNDFHHIAHVVLRERKLFTHLSVAEVRAAILEAASS